MATLEELRARRQQQSQPQRGAWHRFVDNVWGLDDGVMSPGEKLGTMLNNAGESMTFGVVGDEASAAVESVLPGVNYADRRDHYRQQQAQLREENPALSLGSEVAGALVVPGLGVAKGAGLATRMARGAGVGALGGGTYGFAEGEGGVDDRMQDARTGALLGGAVGGAIPLAGKAIEGALNNRATNRAIRNAARNAPSTDDLRAMGQQAYREVDQAGVQITPQAWQRLTGEMRDVAQQAGMDLTPGNPNTPRAAYNIGRAETMGQQMAGHQNPGLPFASIDQYRRSLGSAAGDFSNKTEQSIATQMIQKLDDFIDNIGPNDVVAGDAKALRSALDRAREVWGRMRRSDMLDQAADRAENYVSGPASGMRNQFASILRNPRLSRGFTDAEKAAMRKVVNGTFPERVIHLLGGGMGQHFTSLMGAVGGTAAGGPVGGVAGFLGSQGVNAVARNASEAIAEKNADVARRAIASGALRGQAAPAQANRDLIEQMLQRALRPAYTTSVAP